MGWHSQAGLLKCIELRVCGKIAFQSQAIQHYLPVWTNNIYIPYDRTSPAATTEQHLLSPPAKVRTAETSRAEARQGPLSNFILYSLLNLSANSLCKFPLIILSAQAMSKLKSEYL